MNRLVTWAIAVSIIAAMLVSCNGSGTSLQPGALGLSQMDVTGTGLTATQWQSALPAEGVQPWEELNSEGYVVPASGTGHGASAINADSEFVPGVERYLEGGDATDNGEATHLGSAPGSISHSIYRIPLGGDEPGVISVDANTTAGDGYYVGLADYGRDAWEWHGPFTDNHIRLQAGEGDYTSPLGSVFICVLAYNGAACDVVGIGVNAIDSGDSTAPPAPGEPTLTPISGGLLLEWMPVISGDLAGYRIYHNTQWFLDGHGTGVQVVDQLEGLTSHVLTGISGQTFVRLTAVDTSGNESELGGSAWAIPFEGSAGIVQVTASATSGMLQDSITLTATGADTYDIDTDGDGAYDIMGNTTGTAEVNTSTPGIVRVHVRGTSGGTSFAQGGATVNIANNNRPVANAMATPTSGEDPLDVSFTGDESTDFDGDIVGGGWDFDGDGTYDVWDDTDIVHVTSADYTYTIPGVYNAKLRVVDNLGAWDVDTVAIVVAQSNYPPVAVLSAESVEGEGSADFTFDASESGDIDGIIADYEWDFDGDGTFNEIGAELDARSNPNPPAVTYYIGLPVNAGLRVTDEDMATDTTTYKVIVHGWDNMLPVYDEGIDYGRDAALAIVGGNPAICYGGLDTTDLFYVRATDADGVNWSDPIVIGTDFNNIPIEVPMSMVVVNGNPAICYFNLNSHLGYIRATDTLGTAWGTSVEADSSNQAYDSQLAIIDGYPAIAYKSVVGGDIQLRYVRASDANGAAWPASVMVDSTGNSPGDGCSLVVVNGNPAISHTDTDDHRLWYVRALDAQGSSWDTPVMIFEGLALLQSETSMVFANGKPLICYKANSTLECVRALDASGDSWGAPILAAGFSINGVRAPMILVDGIPAIAFCANNMSYVLAENADGTAWGTVEVADPYFSSELKFASLVVLADGMPAISYYNKNTQDLKFARKF